jgi:hypothetical protein
MKDATKRTIVRCIHLVFSIPILGYIYSPFEVLPTYAPRVRYVVVPLMLLSGLWMWKGHVLRRFISKQSAIKVLQRNESHKGATNTG